MAWNYALIDRIVAGKDRWLIEHPSAAQAIGAAWPTADPAGRRRLIGALLERQSTENGVMLIRRYADLDPGSQAELALRIDRLHRPLGQVLNHSDPAGQFHALTLIGSSTVGSLAYLIIPKLRHDDPALREQAGWCLGQLVHRIAEMDPAAAVRLTETVGDAVVRYGYHQHPAALRAWLALGTRALVNGSGPAIEALQDANHPAVGPMRQLLRDDEQADVKRGLVTALALPTLALAAVQGLRRCLDNGTLGSVIAGREHLLDLPAIRRGLARSGEPAELLPALETLETLQQADSTAPPPLGSAPAQANDHAASAWPAWIDALPAPPLAKAVRLGVLLHHPHHATRQAAMARLTALADAHTHPGNTPGNAPGNTQRSWNPSGGVAGFGGSTRGGDNTQANDAGRNDPRVVHEAVRGLTHSASYDPSAVLARLAAAWLMARPEATRSADLLQPLLGSTHLTVQRAVARRLKATAFDRLWRSWPTLDHRARLAATRATLQQDPATLRRLEARLRRGGVDRRRALEIVTTAGQARKILDQHKAKASASATANAQAHPSHTLAGGLA